MESYLVDEAVLGETADALIKGKYPGEPLEKYADLKKSLMGKLDHQIIKAIVGSLTEEQGEELNKLLSENTSDPDGFDDFFAKNNINLEEIIKNAVQNFKADFEKGGLDA